MHQRRFLLFALGLSLLLGACSPAAPDKAGVTNDGTYVSGTGSVTHYTFEGGFWAIRGDDNVIYDPINLDKTYWSQGLRVRFKALLRKDMGGIHMAGPIVEIISIARM